MPFLNSDGNCFFLSPSDLPLVSIIILMTPCFGVHEFKSLSQSLIIFLFCFISLQAGYGIVLKVGLRVFSASLFEFL